DWHVLQQRLGEDARVVHQDVDTTESCDRLVRHRLHARLVADVRADEQRLATAGLDRGDDVPRLLRRHLVRDDDVRAFAREGDGDASTDARGGTGDDRYP